MTFVFSPSFFNLLDEAGLLTVGHGGEGSMGEDVICPDFAEAVVLDPHPL